MRVRVAYCCKYMDFSPDFTCITVQYHTKLLISNVIKRKIGKECFDPVHIWTFGYSASSSLSIACILHHWKPVSLIFDPFVPACFSMTVHRMVIFHVQPHITALYPPKFVLTTCLLVPFHLGVGIWRMFSVHLSTVPLILFVTILQWTICRKRF